MADKQVLQTTTSSLPLDSKSREILEGKFDCNLNDESAFPTLVQPNCTKGLEKTSDNSGTSHDVMEFEEKDELTLLADDNMVKNYVEIRGLGKHTRKAVRNLVEHLRTCDVRPKDPNLFKIERAHNGAKREKRVMKSLSKPVSYLAKAILKDKRLIFKEKEDPILPSSDEETPYPDDKPVPSQNANNLPAKAPAKAKKARKNRKPKGQGSKTDVVVEADKKGPKKPEPSPLKPKEKPSEKPATCVGNKEGNTEVEKNSEPKPKTSKFSIPKIPNLEGSRSDRGRGEGGQAVPKRGVNRAREQSQSVDRKSKRARSKSRANEIKVLDSYGPYSGIASNPTNKAHKIPPPDAKPYSFAQLSKYALTTNGAWKLDDVHSYLRHQKAAFLKRDSLMLKQKLAEEEALRKKQQDEERAKAKALVQTKSVKPPKSVNSPTTPVVDKEEPTSLKDMFLQTQKQNQELVARMDVMMAAFLQAQPHQSHGVPVSEDVNMSTPK